MFSRNTRSSRACPTNKLIKEVLDSPAKPIFWGANKQGMQPGKECTNKVNRVGLKIPREEAWDLIAKSVAKWAESFYEAGYHKEIVNRLIEPFLMTHTIISFTEISNFLKLRLHEHAQADIRLLANLINKEINKTKPISLLPGQWHLPYITETEKNDFSLSELKLISTARIARVSYTPYEGKIDIDKDIQLGRKLIRDKHMSPTESIATPIDLKKPKLKYVYNKFGNYWGGNFKSFMQYRQEIEGPYSKHD
jgi:hypothetical protein